MLKNRYLLILILILIFVFVLALFIPSQAQQRFKAGIIAGVTAAQLNGDASAGFNKLGLVGGIRGIAVLSDKMELSIELLYSQQGSRTNFDPISAAPPQTIHLNYASVPIVFNYLDWEGDDYYRLHFHAGFNFGRLLSVKLKEPSFQSVVDEFNNNDIAWLAGATYYINEKVGITARYTRSINLLFNNNKVTTVNANSLLGYFLTFHGVYVF